MRIYLSYMEPNLSIFLLIAQQTYYTPHKQMQFNHTSHWFEHGHRANYIRKHPLHHRHCCCRKFRMVGQVMTLFHKHAQVSQSPFGEMHWSAVEESNSAKVQWACRSTVAQTSTTAFLCFCVSKVNTRSGVRGKRSGVCGSQWTQLLANSCRPINHHVRFPGNQQTLHHREYWRWSMNFR